MEKGGLGRRGNGVGEGGEGGGKVNLRVCCTYAEYSLGFGTVFCVIFMLVFRWGLGWVVYSK